MAHVTTMPALDSPEMAQLTLGTLTQVLPLDTVVEKLTTHGCASKYACALPMHLLVFLLITQAWKKSDPYREILRWLRQGLQACWGADKLPATPVGRAAIGAARKKLKWEVLRDLFAAVVTWLATPQTRGAWYQGLRLVAFDGTTLAVPDTAKNREAFGKPGSKHGPGAFPLVHLVALVELGTHAIVGVALGAMRQGETTLVRPLLPLLGAGLLCLADRNYFSYGLWQEARATGAHLLWRVKANLILPCEQLLDDGSYLSTIYPSTKARAKRERGIRVRVIEYTLPGTKQPELVYRLLTSWLDATAAPAEELLARYPERWEEEGVFKEVKTVLCGGARAVLRSQSPNLVKQEIYGLLLAHYALRRVIHDAALEADEDPDRLSFSHTLRVIRRALPAGAALPPSGVVALV
jgi:hypothetical protein